MGIIHRDVKPQNVMVWFDADKGVVRAVLADFGLARWLPRREEDEAAAAKDFLASLQGQGHMMTRQVVTLWYRAPEILLADTISPKVRYTSAIDVWSLGCVVYEIVTGEALAPSGTEQGVLRKIVRAIGPCPPPLRAVYGDRSSRLVLAEQNAGATWQGHASATLAASGAAAAACVTKTLQWKPSDRPACEELLQDAWMQASGGSQDSAEAGAADEAHRPQAAMDSVEAAAADEVA